MPPVKIVAGNKCDLKEGRVISSRQGLEWARKMGCGFMETSAREMVNIEETFARTLTPFLNPFLVPNQKHNHKHDRTDRGWYRVGETVLVRRVAEARRTQASGAIYSQPHHTAQQTLTSLRTQQITPMTEKQQTLENYDRSNRPAGRGRSGRGGGFWARLRCW